MFRSDEKSLNLDFYLSVVILSIWYQGKREFKEEDYVDISNVINLYLCSLTAVFVVFSLYLFLFL